MIDTRRGERFRYGGYSFDAATGQLSCTYLLDGRSFTEQFRFAAAEQAWRRPEVAAAVRLVFLLAGVSYYKTAAPPVIDLGEHAVSETERAFLRTYYLDGLGEFAYVNNLDLSDLMLLGPQRRPGQPVSLPAASAGRPLVPFGGGIDSIVVADRVRNQEPDAALFVVSGVGERFAPIEAAAAITGLQICRAVRILDPAVLRSSELGFFNGHVPVTGILSALAVTAALLDGRDAVVMSNEYSASANTLEHAGRGINHQYSKSLSFESDFRDVLSELMSGFSYFSALRPYSELMVAERFTALPEYHLTFRSCNRAFHIDSKQRQANWCGKCDKCCFTDLILAPFLPSQRLTDIFGGTEPLRNPDREAQFRALLGETNKPFECVGDVSECSAAILLAADRSDRRDTPMLLRLAAELRASGKALPDPALLMRPQGPHFIEERYATADLVD